MRILCTICARGGSKGVSNKNIKLLHGKPLIAHTIEQALNTKLINRVVVSTDSEEIVNIAKRHGAEVPFIRPSDLATDYTPKLPVIQHAVEYCIKNMGFGPDYVVDLDPTSPLRTIKDIENCINLIKSNSNCDSVITGYRSNKNPYFNMVETGKDGFAKLCKQADVQITDRQSAPIVFAMNASIYVWKTEILLNQNNILSGRVKLVEMPEGRSIDIDSEVDFKLVELIMKENMPRYGIKEQV
jgi:CMP-N,N'-diacetyllegionaminic acid synthase